ncbi:MAG: hypothetical protein FWD52_08270 [Candidatus Bathyarchaeota archaeon]|nr:hypothetical protein [Candidatus Termiticorpusculum sp.]
MIIDQFVVQPSISFVGAMIAGVILLVVGVTLVLVAVSNRLTRLAHIASRINSFFSVYKDTGNKYAWIILGMVLIISGGLIVCATASMSSSSVVTIGDGYINIESKAFTVSGLFGISDNKKVASEEIAIAFVGQVGSGAFTLHRQFGLDSGVTNIGVFTLGNGATAYIASTNSTNLIVELKTGEYLIVGTTDIQALADSFAQNVYPLQTP